VPYQAGPHPDTADKYKITAGMSNNIFGDVVTIATV